MGRNNLFLSAFSVYSSERLAANRIAATKSFHFLFLFSNFIRLQGPASFDKILGAQHDYIFFSSDSNRKKLWRKPESEHV